MQGVDAWFDDLARGMATATPRRKLLGRLAVVFGIVTVGASLPATALGQVGGPGPRGPGGVGPGGGTTGGAGGTAGGPSGGAAPGTGAAHPVCINGVCLNGVCINGLCIPGGGGPGLCVNSTCLSPCINGVCLSGGQVCPDCSKADPNICYSTDPDIGAGRGCYCLNGTCVPYDAP